MLSETVTAELRRELDRLLGIRQAADHKIGAIRALLNGDDARPDRNGTVPVTMAQRIVAAMSQIGHPTTTGEVAQALERGGFVVKGKTDLQTLVSSELWRMASRGVGVKRVRHGVYELLDDGDK